MALGSRRDGDLAFVNGTESHRVPPKKNIGDAEVRTFPGALRSTGMSQEGAKVGELSTGAKGQPTRLRAERGQGTGASSREQSLKTLHGLFLFYLQY